MGHWEHKGYDYYDEASEFRAPTLLAAGLKDLKVEGSGKITVVMWPIVVDTVFTAEGNRTAAPAVSDGKPGKVSLLPLEWGVKWTVKKGASGNGFEDLITAQKVTDAAAGNNLLVTSKAIIRTGGQENTSNTLTIAGKEIRGFIGNDSVQPNKESYTAGITKIGTEGSVQFNLEYVPFNLNDTDKWSSYIGKSKFAVSGKKIPVWIIRNGINDLAQDSSTDFTKFGENSNANANGNGAVSYVVAADGPNNPPQAGDLVIKDGKFVGPSSSEMPKIKFSTEGYTEKAEAYYAVVSGEGTSSAPGYSAYSQSLGSFFTGKEHEGTIDLRAANRDLAAANGNYDVYVILFKDGKVSLPIKINTKKGGEEVDWIWDTGDPYKSFYVASYGKDDETTNDGTKEAPFATVQKALAAIATEYEDPNWPGKGTKAEKAGGIIIVDTVVVSRDILINRKQKIDLEGGGTKEIVIYPPLILSDDPKTPGGKLKAISAMWRNTTYGLGLIHLGGGGSLFLEGHLVLEGENLDKPISGVMVFQSNFFMNGGRISGFTSHGVHVYGNMGGFTMNGGVISGNYSFDSGAGVWAESGGTAINKKGGIIYGYEDGNVNSNVVKNKEGAIVNQKGHAIYLYYVGKYRDDTLGEDDNISSSSINWMEVSNSP
jgi:hypothetical protein